MMHLGCAHLSLPIVRCPNCLHIACGGIENLLETSYRQSGNHHFCQSQASGWLALTSGMFAYSTQQYKNNAFVQSFHSVFMFICQWLMTHWILFTTAHQPVSCRQVIIHVNQSPPNHPLTRLYNQYCIVYQRWISVTIAVISHFEFKH